MRHIILPLLIFFCSVVLSAQETFVVNVDLGGTEATLPWNILSNSNNGSANQLWAMNGQRTAISIEVYDAFGGTNSNGTLEADASLALPSHASGDSFFGNREEFSGFVEPTAGVMLTGLDTATTYDLSLFASRMASDNRETRYHVQAQNLDTVMYLNVSDNMQETVSATDLVPFDKGIIIIDVTTGSSNNNEFGFYYLGAIRLSYLDEIETIEPSLTLRSPNGGEYWQTGRTPEIRWDSEGLTEVLLEYSADNGENWNEIARTSALSKKYTWTIPEEQARDCLVRITSAALTDQSDANFEITSNDTSSCHLVVLGSSTAAGAGPTSVDSAWVWLYRDTLFQNDTRFLITNLARGGFTTYNILPDGTDIPAGLPQLDTERNITRALSLDPNGLVINLPSNDAANNFDVTTQLSNYDQILSEVLTSDLPFWICTPQPRNNFSPAQKQIQVDMRDSTFIRFGEFAIDFWTGLEDGDSNVSSALDSGDGVHLNNAGHRILLERVLDSRISSFLLARKTGSTDLETIYQVEPLYIFPNPTHDKIQIANLEPPFDLQIFDSMGNLLLQSLDHTSAKIALPQSGSQFVLLTKGNQNYGAWTVKQ